MKGKGNNEGPRTSRGEDVFISRQGSYGTDRNTMGNNVANNPATTHRTEEGERDSGGIKFQTSATGERPIPAWAKNRQKQAANAPPPE